MRILVCLILTAASLVLASPASAQRTNRVGLFIGNANYPDATTPLTTAKDARALADEFRRMSFDTEVRENASKDEMQRTLDAFFAKINKDTVAVLYFGGYGVQVERQNYLIPVNGQIWSEADATRDGINIEAVIRQMDRKGAAVKIIIIDAAYRNPFESRFRPAPAGLAPLDSPAGTLVISSGAIGQVTKPAGGENSLLVTELIKEMRVPGRSAEIVFNDTRRGVSRASGNEQVPWVASSLAEEFSFSPQTASPRPAPSPAPAPSAAPSSPTPPAPSPPAPTASTPAPSPPAPTASTPAPAPPAPTASTPAAPPAPSPAPSALEGPRRAYLGIRYRYTSDADAERIKAGNRRGALVTFLPADAPAAEAGIRVDDLVLRVNGRPVSRQDDLLQLSRSAPPGESILITIFRNGRDEDIKVKSVAVEDAAQRGVASAMVALGAIYRRGDGVPRDYAEARKWFEKAATVKNPSAMVNLGLMYREGEGVTRDHAQSRDWMEKAAALDYGPAMYFLGRIYANGMGVMRDANKARDWYEKSAQRHYAPAMYALGVIYETGDGVARNRGTAITWYQRAAAAGNLDARQALGRMR